MESVVVDGTIRWMIRKLASVDVPIDTVSSDIKIILDFVSGDINKILSVLRNSEDGSFILVSDENIKLPSTSNGINYPLYAYFIRTSKNLLTIDNIEREIQYGTINSKGLSMTTFERLMKTLVERSLSVNSSLTESARNELIAHYHRCMATLTDAMYCKSSRTALYSPNFEFTNVSEAASNKDRLQIMESIVIHWTRQIKDVINNHDSLSSAETSGALVEIDFWKDRAQNLLGIQSQLESPSVCKIIEVLLYAKSNYIGPFETLTKQIVSRAAEANDNLKFLETIRVQCMQLREVEANTIVKILPELLNRIRLIWSYSKYYNTVDRVCGILRKISNDIITRFRNHISVFEILDGDVDFSITRLMESIQCGIDWKSAYHKTKAAIYAQRDKYGSFWDIDDASIFAQIDAFVQRCRDLIDVCESQRQFVRKSSATKGQPGPLPTFGGTKGQETIDGILSIETSFNMHVEQLRKLSYDVLDVRVSHWFDDYHIFKDAVKDLEVLYTNVITASMEINATVSEGVSLIETFQSLAKRDAVKRCVERKAADLKQMFIRQINSCRSEFETNKNDPPLRPLEPPFAGSALWANSFAMMVEKSYDSLQRLKNILSDSDFEDANQGYTQFMFDIKKFKANRFQQWADDLAIKAKDNGLILRLDRPVLEKVESAGANSGRSIGEVVCNFDTELLILFAEVSHWEKFHGEFSIPYAAHDICNKRENLRVMREHVMLVVIAHNDIVRVISAEEKRLFGDLLRRLDRRISQGFSKLTWQSKNMIELYVRDCCSTCNEVLHVVKEFKESKHLIDSVCKTISSGLLLKIDKNVIYEEGLFEIKQREYRVSISKIFESGYNKIMSVLRNMYRNFGEGSTEVLREWKSQVVTIDKMMEQALKKVVKKSLQELSKAINGDAKTEPQLLFTVHIVLDSNKVSYKPSMVSLTDSVNIVAKDIIHGVTVVPRIRSQNFDSTVENAKEGDANKSYFDVISDDNEIAKIVVAIMNGMSTTATELQKYLLYWDKYKALWEMDKEAFIRKYAKGNHSPSKFDAQISHFRNDQNDIQNEDNNNIVNFVRVDCNILKETLISHCTQFQVKLSGLLNQNGIQELKEIFELFRRSRENLATLPSNLEDLSSKIALSKDLKEQLSTLQSRFQPIREIYDTLHKFDVAVKEDEQLMKNTIDTAFDDHVKMISDSEKTLDKSKITMKKELEIQMESHAIQMADMHKQSLEELPFNADKTPEEALQLIAEYQSKVNAAKQQEVLFDKGLGIFGITFSEQKDLATTAKDLDLLSQIWTVKIEWGAAWDTWKYAQFAELDVEKIESSVGAFTKKVGKLGRDIKRWKIWEAIKQGLESFKETIPLIMSLRNKAMRSRHWASLQDKIGAEFDPYSSAFTLNSIVEMGFTAHAAFIGELSSNANKELAIEATLNELEKRWEDVQLDMGTYKDKYYKLKSADDISQFLEDDSVALSTMKASKFYTSFKSRIDEWERTLSTISEVVESTLGVQRKWIYLESIFMSGGDIAKQLPQEYVMFNRLNTDFMAIMEGFYKNPKALKSCNQTTILTSIAEMDSVLERIQKSLDQYLETKRMVFPRFYFVSDDDLLEILGQSRDPVAVQKHIKKCFEGIKTLKMIPPSGIVRTVEAILMNSPDGETAPFAENVVIDGAVEGWLVLVEKSMKRAISKLLMNSLQGIKGKKEKWIKETIGQLLITTSSIVWTQDCSKALIAIAGGSKGAMKQQKKKQVSYLNKLTEMVRGPLSKLERNKVVALITMEIHNRDVIERMIKANCASISDFEWLSQLRFVYSKESAEFGKCEVKQTNSVLEYSYEYQGNNGRLVVTPLTDRCVLTLITAMYLNRGGNPLGPAGTGKTETVKDLGKNLAKYVVVINCSDGMDYKSVGRIFSGLVQSGSWGCFDEFNRIKIEVISVVAMQILSILSAMSAKSSSFYFMGTQIPCNPNCGIFITMNPGYAGRTELPDNLKALMRPVCMMVPDLTMIAEVMLASEGFDDARNMAKKTVTLYSLMTQQLSKQDHYDYGLRNLKAVLNMAGQLKRNEPTMAEEAILMRALRDMNLPKFIKDDERLFRLLLGDLFPSLDLPSSEYGVLLAAIEAELDKSNLMKQEFLVGKIFQLYDSRLTRHCNMLVGDPLGGKSTAWKTLAAAQCSLNKAGNPDFLAVTPFIISPKSIELDELYGAYDLSTFEWKDGILSTIFKSCSEDERPFEKWVLFDGPIDALWIESMNSVMDDNKILTLINGDRIPLSNTMSLVFETQDLRVASPATVSRAGMIYIDASELSWNCYTYSWLNTKFAGDDEKKAFHQEMFEKWVPKVLKFKELNCIEPVKISDFNAVVSLCSLYDAIEKSDPAFNKETLGADFNSVAEKIFLFSLTWTLGGAVNEDGRKKLSSCLLEIDPFVPSMHTVYDYYVDLQKNDFIGWDTRVPSFRQLKSMTFHDMIVPTVDTLRNSYIVDLFVKQKKNVMLVGGTGTGKTLLAMGILKDLPDTHSQLVINFSAATTSSAVQDIMEAPMEKRSKDKLGPQGGKTLIIFVDDFNMPKKTSLESPFQPPLELIRLWLDYQGWYDRSKCTWKYILDSQLMVSMGHPGGGRNEICARTQSRFSLLNFVFPANAQIIRIFESILISKFVEFDNEIKVLTSGIAIATLAVFKAVSADFLATPEKFHYLFNIRDVAKVVQGILMCNRRTVYSPDLLIRLWVHECQRVFADRFVRTKTNDESKFKDILMKVMGENLSKDWGSVMNESLDSKVGPVFCGFLSEPTDEADSVVYSEVTDYNIIRAIVEEKLDDYNLEPKLIPMDLAMFRDAIMHVCRIHRVLVQPRGNIMLVGVGGSGRSSLTRLAAFIANMTTFSIEITKNYRIIEFREDLKKLYYTAGCDNKSVCFLFNDTQIKSEGFLEDVNNILSSGVVPNLFGKDEIPGILDSVRKPAADAGLDELPDILWNFFIDRVRSNLHVVLAMSPIGDSLRNRARMYPGLVNCTTIDWFHTWPAEALHEVAMKFLASVEFTDSEYRGKISTIFADMHLSVISASSRMLLELKRHNYVTPTNYLELVKGYRALLAEKSGTLKSSASKLASGLAKLEDAREQVETLSKELEIKKVDVAKSQKDCEDLLVQIVSDKRIADEQRKQVEADSARITIEAAECKAISDDAEADLAIAMPALEKAMEEVDRLDKSSISEVKNYTKPPDKVEKVLENVMILFGKPTDWVNAKKVLSETNFLQQIKQYNKDNVPQSAILKIKKFVENPEYTPEKVKAVSGAAAALCVWVHAIYIYANVAKEVAPKRQRLKEAAESLAMKQAALKEAQDALAEVNAKLAALQVKYDTSVNEKNRLRDEADYLGAKLDRADKLVNGLAGEYGRWQISIGDFEASLVKVTGDALLAAAFLSYAGPFETSYRTRMMENWLKSVQVQKIPCTDHFSFTKFLAKATDVRDWNIQGLPKDDFSTENGVIATRGGRWPLMIDPQGQANRWIRNMEGSKLRIIDLKMSNFLREVENAIQYGFPVLLQDILEEIDAALEPVLSRSILKIGTREVIRLGDKELDYSPDFRLYITTKLANPHYTPEISTKATVVNFAVKKDGLEAQLLGIVVLKEQPELENSKSELTIRVAAGKKQLAELEDEILKLLSESTGSLLDDEGLVNTLQQSKITSEEVTKQLVEAEETEKFIDIARLGYRPAAIRASLAYFVLDDMSRVDPMYQFSLDSYVDLFNMSIANSKLLNGVEIAVAKRCDDINIAHTLAVYRTTCRGLFEAHKLLFSLQLCFKILESQGTIVQEEFSFFSLGPGLVDRHMQKNNPCHDWMPPTVWDNITEMEKISGFQGIVTSFEQQQRDWKTWYMSGRPEEEVMPGEWSLKCSTLQKLCLVKAIRIDRLLFAASKFIAENIGGDYVDPPNFDLKAVYDTSTCKTPLIFVLSPGVDPTAGILQRAAFYGQRLENCALGQGQEVTAVRMIEDGLKNGNWVFLANCHLMLSWMSTLDKMIETLIIEGTPHPSFRLWLSSSPDPNFPISILQRGIKMTTEPPKGLRSNMSTLYNTISDDQFKRCSQVATYKKLVFALVWFHAILLERRKFKALGFNIPYDFNESDFAICHDLIIVFLDEYPERIPFDAMKYLIAEANYGGRVTDDFDRRLVNVYIGELFCEEAVSNPTFQLSELSEYFIPADGDLKYYKEFIQSMPSTDHPMAFGQHPNADISSQIDDSRVLMDVFVSLQPRVVKAATDDNVVDPLAKQCSDLLAQCPELFDIRIIKEKMQHRSDPDPLKTVLYQELDRYNDLLHTVRRTLSSISKAIQGIAAITSELEDVMDAISKLKVPRGWSRTYPSIKPLGSWMLDLIKRCAQLNEWSYGDLPKQFWLPGFTYPTGFLTAILQTAARANGVAIDALSWEFPILTHGDINQISAAPKEGVYVSGIFVEGACWNFSGGFLEDAKPMELMASMPIVHFKPVEGRKKVLKGFYSCPLYMYPIRTGSRERPSYVVTVELKGGKGTGDMWTKRGVALLLSTGI